jgi:hypothetical protein
VVGALTKAHKKLTIEQLKRNLEEQANLGKEAELIVMNYETKRLGNCKSPKLISEVDVAAGFDIMSYESGDSPVFDRFIEVKSKGKNSSFFWTANEIAKAKLLGNRYYLYLVDISQSRTDAHYEPRIINNPVAEIISPNWLLEPKSFFVSHID